MTDPTPVLLGADLTITLPLASTPADQPALTDAQSSSPSSPAASPVTCAPSWSFALTPIRLTSRWHTT